MWDGEQKKYERHVEWPDEAGEEGDVAEGELQFRMKLASDLYLEANFDDSD